VALEVETYPRLRASREVVSAGAGAGDIAVALPRPRTFWFKVVANAATRSTIMTPPIQGPALIRVMQHGTGAANNANTIALQVSVATVVQEEVNVALTTAKPYRPLIEQMTTFPSGVSANIEGYLSDTPWGSGGDKSAELQFIVTDARFHVSVTCLNASGGAVTYFGMISVIEAMSLDVLANFL
jgi:hypothetical protein